MATFVLLTAATRTGFIALNLRGSEVLWLPPVPGGDNPLQLLGPTNAVGR